MVSDEQSFPNFRRHPLELYSRTLLEPSPSNIEKDKYYAVDYGKNYYTGRTRSHLMKGSSLYWSSFTNYSGQISQGLTGQGIARVFLALLSWKVLAHVKFLILRNWKLTSNQFLRGGKITFSCLNTLMINYHSTLCVLAFLLHTYCKC